jgi:hypothetical protein
MIRLVFFVFVWGFCTVAAAAEPAKGGPALPFSAPPKAKEEKDTVREDRTQRRFKADMADCRKDITGGRAECEREVRSKARTKARRAWARH